MSETIMASILRAGESRDANPAEKRANVVAAVLEVIAAKASGADATNLDREFNNLSAYADRVQEALRVK